MTQHSRRRPEQKNAPANESDSSMTLNINGQPQVCRSGQLLDLLHELGADPSRVAVMVNSVVIQTKNYENTTLHPDDSVDIVYFAGGGAGTHVDNAPAIPPLTLGGHVFKSRLILGTGKFADIQTMLAAVRASGTELVTVALRRFNPGHEADDLLGPLSQMEGITLMPNTSGARNADEAIRAALLGRELSGSPFVKVEIHPNPYHLMPDPVETFEAARRLVKEDFVVMPYMPADPVLAKRLEEIGCASVMPLGAAIGSGGGLQTRSMLELIIHDSQIPVIVDAGIRAPSEAAAAMEIGCDAVLVNSAIAAAEDPAAMATCFASAVRLGHQARAAGLMSMSSRAIATSPLTAFLE